MNTSILAPGAVLILWSLIMLIWLLVARFPALSKIEFSKEETLGARGVDLEKKIPGRPNWPAHNYNHLMEQPTLFYAVILILFVAGGTTPYSVTLAWLYVLLRIMHSVWQAMVNVVPIRFVFFLLSTTCLLLLGIQAVIYTMA